jgi:hypothetical protein
LVKKNLLPLVTFLVLSLAIPLFVTVFETLPSFKYMPVPHWDVWPYPVSQERGTELEKYLLFKISPAFPLLFWRLVTYDYYDGFKWQTTTVSNLIEPPMNSNNATVVFTVELDEVTNDFYLPLPSSEATLSNLTLSPNVKFKLFFDDIAGVCQAQLIGRDLQVNVTYQAACNPLGINEENISLDNIPESIYETYLQLPISLPMEVKLFAQDLINSSFSVFDQILKDVQYMKNNFEYDVDLYERRTQRIISRDWVLTYLEQRKGICLDAATALAVILRCQGIPARVCCGFKPSCVVGDEALYYSMSAHALTEVYLPPYGWVQFDSTPVGELGSLPEDFPPEGSDRNQGSPFYFLRTLTPNTLIRGEQNKIRGLVTTNMEEKISDYVRISLDDREIGTVKTAANGSFTYTFNIPQSEDLRKHILTFESRNATLKQEVRIVARTYLTATSTKRGFFGSSHTVRVVLLDDQGLPLEGQTIKINNYGLSWQTDHEGKAEFSLDLASTIFPEDTSFVVSFDGSDKYLAKIDRICVPAEPNPIVIILVLAGLFYVVHKENLLTTSFILSFRKRKSAEQLRRSPSPIFFKEVLKKTIGSRLRIWFPGIGDSFPAVWGIEDKLLIKCSWECDGEAVSRNKLRGFMNDVPIFERQIDGNKWLDVYHAFDKKGLQKIMVVLYDESDKPLDATEKTLRIVDYREEIIRLYQSFLQGLIERDIDVKDYMTAREILHMFQQAGITSPDTACITDCFEEAEYSSHSVTRRTYETIYLALKELKMNVE